MSITNEEFERRRKENKLSGFDFFQHFQNKMKGGDRTQFLTLLDFWWKWYLKIQVDPSPGEEALALWVISLDFHLKDSFLDLSNLDLRNCNFSKPRGIFRKPRGLSIEMVNFSNSHLHGSNFKMSELRSCNFTKAVMGLSSKSSILLFFACCLATFFSGLMLTYSFELLRYLFTYSPTLDASAEPGINPGSIGYLVGMLLLFICFSGYLIARKGFTIPLVSFWVFFTTLNLVFMIIDKSSISIIPALLILFLSGCIVGIITQAKALFLKEKTKSFSPDKSFPGNLFFDFLFFMSLGFGISLGAYQATLNTPRIWVFLPVIATIFYCLLASYISSEALDDNDNKKYNLIRHIPDLLLRIFITSFKGVNADKKTKFNEADLANADFAFKHIEPDSLKGTGINVRDALVLHASGSANSYVTIIEGNVSNSIVQTGKGNKANYSK
jgi:hypothetical protein